MQYLGGKFKIRREVAAYLHGLHRPGQPYWEPMVGGAWVMAEMDDLDGPRYASDANQALIFMYQRLQRGWTPPGEVSLEAYHVARQGYCDAATTAFIMVGCAFGGNWGHGYARDHRRGGRNYADGARRGLARKLSCMADVHFFAADFLEITPPELGCLIYCDPPYAGTSGYAGPGLRPFDHAAFWERVRWLTAQSHTVIVSEYAAPADFECVLEIPTITSLRLKNSQQERRVERLFRWRPL